jgi:16S rRNA (guanine966-N2)-methyltransferase
MRIISGSLKGRRISPPKNLPVRPTTDRAKEALFNILSHQYDFNGCAVLDLYTGTGAISYEFASRGVAAVTAVDQHAACIRFVQQTAENLKLCITTLKSPVLKFLLSANGSTYDFIFADPPYAYRKDEYESLIDNIISKGMLTKNGLIIIEHAPQIDLSELTSFRTARNYGGCVFSFFEQ